MIEMESRQINDMTRTITTERGDTFTVTYYQHGGYLMSVRDYGNDRPEANIVFSHAYHNHEKNNSKELNTETAHLVDTFLSTPVHTTSDHNGVENDTVEVNLSSFNGSLAEVRRRNQQAMEAVEAAEAFNRVLNR